MKISRFTIFFKNNYILLLFFVVLASFGQLLGMYVWQDDNGLFFKLAHLDEQAGYLSPGPFGAGVYKYVVTPYIPIYNLFGFNTVFYFTVSFVLYFLTAVAIYKTFSSVFGYATGRLSGFLWASGYIASDGIIRLFNSVITSVSVMLITLLFFAYWKFSKVGRAKWYFLALIAFFLVTEFARGRAHYLITIVIIFEFLFLTFEKRFKSLVASVIRLAPFTLIFYQYYVVSADQRSGQVKNLLFDLAGGEFYKTYSLVTTFVNVVIPDWLTNILFTGVSGWFILAAAIIIEFCLLVTQPGRKVFLPIFLFLTVVWKFVVDDIYRVPSLNLGEKELFIVFLGGELLIILLAILSAVRNSYRKVYLLFLSWMILNIAAYAAYNPTFGYESINRYLAHSFFAIIGVWAILYVAVKNSPWKKAFLGLILFWGVGNMISSIVYQHQILKVRSNPARSFYAQLKSDVPAVKKGDVFYFDVADGARGSFADAFSVASMPEETAIAWRYGVDRYDIRRVVRFEDLITLLQTGTFTDKERRKVGLNSVYTFFYNGDTLFNTSEVTKSLLSGNVQSKIISIQTKEDGGGIIIDLLNPISSVVPGELEILLTGNLGEAEVAAFPYAKNRDLILNSVAKNRDKRRLAFKYQEAIESMLGNTIAHTNNHWKEEEAGGLIDQDSETIWRADRVLWKKDGAILTLDLKKVYEIDRLAWVNAFGNNTPTEYKVEGSLDGINWKNLASLVLLKRIDTKDPQIIEFKAEKVQFIRMTISQTLSRDAAGIAEVWPIPVEFAKLDISEALEFLKQPFGFVPDAQSFKETLEALEYLGSVKVYWQNDKTETWSTNNISLIKVSFDGQPKAYKVSISEGGTKITKIRLDKASYPGGLSVSSISFKPYSLNNIIDKAK